MGSLKITESLVMLIADPYAVQIADYKPENDDLPPCFCEGEKRGNCLGDCPYCRIGGFVMHKMGEDW